MQVMEILACQTRKEYSQMQSSWTFDLLKDTGTDDWDHLVFLSHVKCRFPGEKGLNCLKREPALCDL